jgi:hypothetical protein
MRYTDIITEAMQPLPVVYGKMKQGFDHELDSSCYNHVGKVLRDHGDQLSDADAVVAFYGIGDHYNHVAIETQDGRLISERQAPFKFRGPDGRCQRDDMARAIVPVPEVLGVLRAAHAS